MLSSKAPAGGGLWPLRRCSGYGSILPTSQTARLSVDHGLGDFSSNRLGIKRMCSIWRVLVGVGICLSQLVDRTRLEKFRQSRVVVVGGGGVVGAYSPVTVNPTSVGSAAARRVTMLGRGVVLLRIAVPLFALQSVRGRRKPPCLGERFSTTLRGCRP